MEDISRLSIGEEQRSRRSSTYNMVLCTQSMAWKAASNEIPEIKKMLITLNGILSYFAKSGVRSRELNILQSTIILLFAFQKYLKYDEVNSLIN